MPGVDGQSLLHKILFGCFCFLLMWAIRVSALDPNKSSYFENDNIEAYAPDSLKYTVTIDSWKGRDCLWQSVFHYTTCKNLHSIRVIWNLSSPPPDSLFKELSEKVKKDTNATLYFELGKDQTLSGDPEVLVEVTTINIKIYDGVIIPCETLDVASWQVSSDKMIPRDHLRDDLNLRENGDFYNGIFFYPWMNRLYSFILKKAALFSHIFLEYFSSEPPQSVEEYVANRRSNSMNGKQFQIDNENLNFLKKNSRKLSQKAKTEALTSASPKCKFPLKIRPADRCNKIIGKYFESNPYIYTLLNGKRCEDPMVNASTICLPKRGT